MDSLHLQQAQPKNALNVYGLPLQVCSLRPKTGYTRDGYCQCFDNDPGHHCICVQVTDKFLEFSKAKGNDLSTPRTEYNFPGLKAGEQWCLCTLRWVEAYEAGCAPHVCLESSHQDILKYIDLETLEKYQV